MNASDDNEFDIGIRPIGINFVNMWRYITFKVGQNRDRVRSSGQFSIPRDLVIFPGQAVKIRDCLEKIRTDGHLRQSVSSMSDSLGRNRWFAMKMENWSLLEIVTPFNVMHFHLYTWTCLAECTMLGVIYYV